MLDRPRLVTRASDIFGIRLNGTAIQANRIILYESAPLRPVDKEYSCGQQFVDAIETGPETWGEGKRHRLALGTAI
jgi:hypothetical protein